MIQPSHFVPPVTLIPPDSEAHPPGGPDPLSDEGEAPFAPLPNHLQPLSRKLTQAAIELLSYAERNEIHLFEAVIGGQRLAIDIAVLPRVGQDSVGAMRTLPLRPELPGSMP